MLQTQDTSVDVAEQAEVEIAVQTEESLQQIDTRIRRTFAVMGRIAESIISGEIRALIVSGATGCGKTYTLETAFREAEERGEITYRIVRGTMSGIGLYQQLWHTRTPNSVLVIDDTDNIFREMDCVNLLKNALDTGKRRRVSWLKESRVLKDEGIDNEFDHEGAVVFITNTDFQAKIDRGSAMSPHYNALLGRCLYIDLGIHTRREIMVRIGQVVFSQQFLTNNNITRQEAQEMVVWLRLHLDRVRVLSIRTVLALVTLVKSVENWKDMAEVTLLTKPTLF